MTRTEKLRRLQEDLDAAILCDHEGLSAYCALTLFQLAREAEELGAEIGAAVTHNFARSLKPDAVPRPPRPGPSAFDVPTPRPLEVLPAPAGSRCEQPQPAAL